MPGTKWASKLVGAAVCPWEVRRGTPPTRKQKFWRAEQTSRAEHRNSLGPLLSRPVTWERDRNLGWGGAAPEELGDRVGVEPELRAGRWLARGAQCPSGAKLNRFARRHGADRVGHVG